MHPARPEASQGRLIPCRGRGRTDHGLVTPTRGSRRGIPRDVARSLKAAAVALTVIGNFAVYVMAEVVDRGWTAPAFLGAVLGSVQLGQQGYGRWVLDYARIRIPGDDIVRREVRDLLTWGAAGVFALMLQIAFQGGLVALKGDTVPAILGTSFAFALGTLVQYGTWVLEASKPPKRRTPPPMA